MHVSSANLLWWRMTYRPIRLIQCCTQFKSPADKILCVLYLHYNVAFTFKWYGNSLNKTFYSQRVWIGYNIWVYSRIGLFASYLISFIIFSFPLKDQFLILLRSAAAAQKILEAQVFFEQNYFLRDQYTCLHTDHFIQLFNSTIKHKHLWRTFLALKITLIFIEIPCGSLCRGLCLWWQKNKLSAPYLLPEHLAINFPLTFFDDLQTT